MARRRRNRKVLFLCQDNACLSVIAEAIATRLGPPETQVLSAGIVPDHIDKTTVEGLAECGIDLSGVSKGLDQVSRDDVDLIVVLGSLDGPAPIFPMRTKWEYWPVADPRKAPGIALESIRNAIDDVYTRVAGLFLDHWRFA
jgi:protein-tyrosine-phosphatase